MRGDISDAAVLAAKRGVKMPGAPPGTRGVHSRTGPGSRTIKIFVQISSNKIIALDNDVKNADNICVVKRIIYSKVGIPCDQQRLFFGEEELKDDRSVASYNIQKESTLILRPRGGNGDSNSVNADSAVSATAMVQYDPTATAMVQYDPSATATAMPPLPSSMAMVQHAPSAATAALVDVRNNKDTAKTAVASTINSLAPPFVFGLKGGARNDQCVWDVLERHPLLLGRSQEDGEKALLQTVSAFREIDFNSPLKFCDLKKDLKKMGARPKFDILCSDDGRAVVELSVDTDLFPIRHFSSQDAPASLVQVLFSTSDDGPLLCRYVGEAKVVAGYTLLWQLMVSTCHVEVDTMGDIDTLLRCTLFF